jgi:hypothetical protein
MWDREHDRPRPLVTIYGTFAAATIVLAACFGFATQSDVFKRVTDAGEQPQGDATLAPENGSTREDVPPPTESDFAEPSQDFYEPPPPRNGDLAGRPVDFGANNAPAPQGWPGTEQSENIQPQAGAPIVP